MTTTEILAGAGGLAGIIALVAWIAERRRTRRRNLDRVGFMPWTGIFFCALLAAVVLFALALQAGRAG